MLRRMLAPMLLVFPLVLFVAYFLMKLSEPVEPPPSPEAIQAQETAKLRTLLKQWQALPAAARQAAASQLVGGLDYPLEDLLWDTTWALGELGPAAVPVLVQALNQPDGPSHARGHALWALGLIGPDAKAALPQVKAALADPHPDVRGHAAFAVSQIDASAADAVPALLPLLADSTPDVVEAAVQAIVRYRDQAVPLLRKALTDPSAAVRKQAVVTLGLLGEHGGGAVGDLIVLVRDPNHPLRAEAAEALGNIGAPALAALTAALQDPSDSVRWQAADALGRIGRSAITTLTPALKDDNVNVRLQALTALTPFADEVVEPVCVAGQDAAPAVRELAVQVLALVRQPDHKERVVPCLLAAMADGEMGVRRQAALALRRLQPPADQVLPHMKPLTENPSARVRGDAIGYLYSAGFGNRAVPFLALALKDPDDQVQSLAIKILEEMKADPVLLFERIVPLLAEKDNETARVNALNVLWRAGPPALAPLLTALQDPSAKVRRMAVWALHQGNLDTAQFFPQLLPALKDADAGVRANGMAALARHGAPGVPHLADGLKDPDVAVQVQAATALGYVQAKPADVLPLLDQALKSSSEDVRVAAAAALEHLGPPAANLLLLAFRDQSDKVWKQALKSLIRMQADNQVLLPILLQATRHEDASVRAGAAYALERFQGDAVKPLIGLLQSDQDPSVHWAVVDVIDTIGMPARAAFPHLVEPALKHPAAKVRYGALVAMLKMVGLEKYRETLTLERHQERIGIVVPHLLRALEDRRDAEWRWQAALLLGVIGPPAKEAVPALTRALDDSEPRVRDAAREALQRIGK